jgi:hypothetical protein
MSQCIRGQKKIFSNSELKIVNVPNFPELTAKKVFDMAMKHPVISQYLPEHSFKRPLNREYLFNVRIQPYSHR